MLPGPLLGEDEPGPWEEWRPRRAGLPVLLACDHASPRVPAALADLGLARPEYSRHIAFDIGAAALTRTLAGLLDVPAVLSRYSRLVVDCNRHLHDPSAFPESSDGVIIPGNRALDAAARTARVAALYRPYHDAIANVLASLGSAASLIAVHSFTPQLDGFVRPWHIGVLWDQDDRLAMPLLRELRGVGGLNVGDNEPYSGRHPAGYTVGAHAESRGLPHVSIEVRQDLLASSEGIAHWAALLASALRPILADRFGA